MLYRGLPWIIFVDCDEVVLKFIDGLIGWSNREYGMNIRVSEIIDYYNPYASLGYSREQAWALAEEYHDSEDYHGLEAHEGAAEGLAYLARLHQLVLGTLRPWDVRSFTEVLLEQRVGNPFVEKLFMAERGKRVATKAQMMKQYGADLLINDHPKNVQECCDVGIPCVLFGDYGWNRNYVLPKLAVRARNWSEVPGAIALLAGY